MSSHRTILRRCVPCGKAHWLPRGQDHECPTCRRPFFQEEKKERPPNVQFDWKPWVSENLDHYPVLVKSRQHWKELMKERGLRCRDYES